MLYLRILSVAVISCNIDPSNANWKGVKGAGINLPYGQGEATIVNIDGGEINLNGAGAINIVGDGMIGTINTGGNNLRPSSNFQQIVGNGQPGKQTRNVNSFDKLDIAGNIKVQYSQGPLQPVVIEADKNLLSNVVVQLQGTVLYLRMKSGSYRTVLPIKVTVSSPTLKSLRISGSSSFVANSSISTNGNALNLDASGASSVSFGNVVASTVRLIVSGSSSVQGISGSVSKLDVNASGSAVVDASKLFATNADVDASGACSVTVKPGRLDATASGASSVYYTGEPNLGQIETSGASSVGRTRG